MSTYFVFGGCLRSELDFPDLSPVLSPDQPDWQLRLDTSDPPEPIELQGTRWIEPDWEFRLYRVANGQRLDYGGVGSFGIYSGGRELVWYPGSRPEDERIRLEMARAIVLGPVMALALQQAGILCLHGSAVTIGEEAVAFLAPKFHGKSTLALALTAAGGRLLTDDLVAIRPSASPVVLPGVHSVRVMKDVAEQLGERFSEATIAEGFKTTFSDLPAASLAWEPTPLAAIYLLEPRAGLEDDLSARREAVSTLRAALELAHGKKLTDGLIGSAEAGSMLEWIATVTANVPVYRMAILRDLERLPEVVAEVMAWHGVTASVGDV
jgi:hypothetical protein